MSTDAQTAGLPFHPLTYLEENGETTIGRSDIDSYGLFPADGAALVRRLENGSPPDQAAAWYLAEYGETVDIDHFLDVLNDLEFIRDRAAAKNAPESAEPVRWQRTGKALFSPAGWLCMAVIVAATIVVWVQDPGLLPRRRNVFFSPYLLVIEFTVAVGQLPLMIFHEMFHCLAGRRLGLNTRVRVGRRLYFLVLETAMDGLVVVPRRKRFLPMLAGMLADVLVICVFTLIARLLQRPDGSFPLLSGAGLALAFATLLRILMQFYFFLRTDIYYLIVTLLGCVDLDRTAREVLANRFWARLHRPARMVDETQWHPRDVAVARWYAPLLVAGRGLSFITLATVLLPITWRFLSTAVHTLTDPNAPASRVWDSAVLLALNLAQLGLAGVLAWRARRAARTSTDHVIDLADPRSSS